MRDPIEQVQSKFCKMLLGVSKTAANKACRAELGRYLLQTEITKNNLAYWFRVIKQEPQKLTKIAFNDMNTHKKELAAKH